MRNALLITVQVIGWIAAVFFLIGGISILGPDTGGGVFLIVVALLIAAALAYPVVRRRRGTDQDARRAKSDRNS